jgi:hypothetical protein
MVLDRKPIYQLLNPTKDTNSYSASISVSQILTKDSIIHFMDVLQQEGLLGTPYQRVYFADKANYYVGQAQYIVYTTSENKGVYQLADDKERLPSTFFKIPIEHVYILNMWSPERTIDIIRIIGNSGTYIYRAAH